MENKKYKIDESKLTPEQRDQLESYNNTKKQLRHLEDTADIAQEILQTLDEQKEQGAKTLKEFGALFVDMREALKNIESKEDPESPDISKPIVEVLNKLQKSFDGFKVNPEVKVSVPDIKVPEPDLAEFKKIVKTELPKAFEKAIKLIPKVEIPKTDHSDLLKAWEGISEQLVSIENATRMKPQFPTSLKVTNPDGSTINSGSGKTTDAYGIQAISDDGTYKYFFFENDDTNYYVMRKNLTTKVFSYTKGTGSYTTVYVDENSGPSGSPTWGTRGATFP